MSDDRKQTDRKPSNAPKDLPAKPIDKRTDDKVKGGRAPDTSKIAQ